MDEHTVNLNSAQCIHSISHWGETAYQNICTGTLAHVPWGSGDYALAIFGYSVIAFVGMLAICLVLFILHEAL
jgi:hypothetical protein